jgi:hypothetical protein
MLSWLLDNGIVLSFVPLAGYHPLTAVFNQGVGKSSYYKGLCHVTYGFLNRLGSKLPLFPEESSANSGAEGQEDFLLFEFGHGVQVRCQSPIGHVLQPGVPTVGSGFVIHCCISNRSPSSVDITLESMAGVGCASR